MARTEQEVEGQDNPVVVDDGRTFGARLFTPAGASGAVKYERRAGSSWPSAGRSWPSGGRRSRR